MSDSDGGDPACWLHLFNDDVNADDCGCGMHVPAVFDLGGLELSELAGPSGAVWSLPHGGDLDANLVYLHPGHAIEEHVNDEVDVLMVVRSGSGEIVIDADRLSLRGGVLALVPRGTRRRITAGPSGLAYLSVHRGRGPVGINAARRRR